MNLEKEVHPKPKKIGSNKESSKKKSDNVKESEEKTAKIKQKKLPKESLEIIKKKNTIKDFFNSLWNNILCLKPSLIKMSILNFIISYPFFKPPPF